MQGGVPSRPDLRHRALPRLLGAALALGAVHPACSAALQAQQPARTTVILLGTGIPYPDPRAGGPATAVVFGSRTFLFDAGAGVMRAMNAAGLPISGPEAAFITHLHSDHTLGLPDLMFTTWIMRRRRPFPLIGPPGLARMVDLLAAAWEEDIRIRTDGLEREPAGGWRLDVREVQPGLAYDSAGVRVTAVPVEHGNWEISYAWLVRTPDRTILISGDARPGASLEAAARGVDVLVCEVYPESRIGPEDRPGGELWPEYLRSFHISDRELGALASRARPGLLVLTHLLRMGASDEEILAGVRAGGYRGPLVMGRDLGRY